MVRTNLMVFGYYGEGGSIFLSTATSKHSSSALRLPICIIRRALYMFLDVFCASKHAYALMISILWTPTTLRTLVCRRASSSVLDTRHSLISTSTNPSKCLNKGLRSRMGSKTKRPTRVRCNRASSSLRHLGRPSAQVLLPQRARSPQLWVSSTRGPAPTSNKAQARIRSTATRKERRQRKIAKEAELAEGQI